MKTGTLSLLILVVGCNGALVDENPPPSAAALCDSARALRRTPEFLTVPEEADIASRVLAGGFGGLYADLQFSNGSLVAYFKDPDPVTERKLALRAILNCGAVYPGWAGAFVRTDVDAIAIRQGQFTATELLSYLNALKPLEDDPAVWAVEVDPEVNQVWVGLADISEFSRIRQAVVAKSVPPHAVSIEAPPPTTGLEQFEVLNAPFTTVGEDGVFGIPLWVRFTNRQGAVRYPQWCVDPDPERFRAYFLYTIEKWNGVTWQSVKGTLCVSILLPPRNIEPGNTASDSIPVVGVRRLNSEPRWRTARITGTYRFVGALYRSTTGGDPSAEPVWLTDPAPAEENVSAPFRIINRLPF